MTEAVPRSARAELARTVCLYAFGVAFFINAFFVQILELDFLDHGGWLVPRYALTAVTACAGLVWAWETYKRRRDGGVVTYSGSISVIPTSLDDLAADPEGATCHVCDEVADVVVRVLNEDANIKSAMFLCDQDAALVSQGDVDALSRRISANYEVPLSESTDTARSMVHETGQSVRLVDR